MLIEMEFQSSLHSDLIPFLLLAHTILIDLLRCPLDRDDSLKVCIDFLHNKLRDSITLRPLCPAGIFHVRNKSRQSTHCKGL